MFRFRLRTLLVGVALIGVTLGGITWTMRMRRLSANYRGIATDHANKERINDEREHIAKNDYITYIVSIRKGDKRYIDNLNKKYGIFMNSFNYMYDSSVSFGKLANYHAMLKAKYRYAATHPWLPIAPDPPPPPDYVGD